MTFEVTASLHVGVEYWMRAKLDDYTHHFVGPAISVQFKKLWWSVAPYLRLDGLGTPTPYNDPFGRFWVRSVIGLNL